MFTLPKHFEYTRPPKFKFLEITLDECGFTISPVQMLLDSPAATFIIWRQNDILDIIIIIGLSII